MAIFDPYIKAINCYITGLRNSDRQVRELCSVTDTEAIRRLLPLNDEQKLASGIVLKADTFLELGNPTTGSCAISLYTDQPGLIKDGHITLIGPDIQDAPLSVLPFGQVIMVGGKQLTDEDYHQLLQGQSIAGVIAGYMVRSTTENIWSRISREAAQKGFTFEVLGSVLRLHVKKVLPKAESVDILFVTSMSEDIIKLNEIAVPVREIARNIKEKVWKERGIDIFKCYPAAHCGSCADKQVCNNIRRIAVEAKRRAGRFAIS